MRFHLAACGLLVYMALLAGGAAMRESPAFDEVAHVGAGVSYLQKLDLRLNPEHPPLAKIAAAIPLVIGRSTADYSTPAWTVSDTFSFAYASQWVFGDLFLSKWNEPMTVIRWARVPLLLLTLAFGWVLYRFGTALGGPWGGLLVLALYVSSPVILAFGPLVATDVPVTFFAVLTVWTAGNLWTSPDRRNITLFASALAAALLSKFSGIVLIPAMLVFALTSRWWPIAGQPSDRTERKLWRRTRWGALLRGMLGALAIVYLVYFVLSLNQDTGAVERLGNAVWMIPIRRLVLPAWLYLRGALLMVLLSSRPTYLLGNAYPHGVWFYFPIVTALKSTIGFLVVVALAAVAGILKKLGAIPVANLVPPEVRAHWRAIWVTLVLFAAVCMLGRLNISLRHFIFPLVLAMLLASVLPRIVERLWAARPLWARAIASLSAGAAVASLVAAVAAYPYFIPYVNAFGGGQPVYALVNDANVDWNQSLPEAAQFVRARGLREVRLDYYAMSDPAPFLPGAQVWNCESPSPADAGTWAIVSGNMIRDSHDCRWLEHYSHEPLAGGSMYAFHLPAQIPAAGAPGGPPVAHRQLFGMMFDLRTSMLDMIHHPETIQQVLTDMQAQFRSQNQKAN